MRVLLGGSTSYVASFFVAEAARRGWDILGLSRDRIRHGILYGRAGRPPLPVSFDEAAALGRVDAIVNFAYPRDLSTFKVHTATRRLMAEIAALARQLSPKVVIQISTKTVFGYAFVRPPQPVPVRWAAGDGYIETKALAEWLFLRASRQAGYVPVILRLGNVIGPGAHWVTEVARRVLFEEPLGRGQSNATDARNVADYLAALAEADDPILRGSGVFHHLAEFSSVTWDRFIDPVASTMGLVPVYGEAPSRPPRVPPRALVTTTAALLSMMLPEAWQDRAEALRSPAHRSFRADGRPLAGLAAVPPGLHETLPFRSHTLPGWTPRFELSDAIGEAVAWVRRAGYVTQDATQPSGARP